MTDISAIGPKRVKSNWNDLFSGGRRGEIYPIDCHFYEAICFSDGRLEWKHEECW